MCETVLKRSSVTWTLPSLLLGVVSTEPLSRDVAPPTVGSPRSEEPCHAVLQVTRRPTVTEPG